MMEFYFAVNIIKMGTLSAIEREIVGECESKYLDRIISSDQLLEMVEDFRDISKNIIRKNPRLKPAKISLNKRDYGAVLAFGRSYLSLSRVKGSYKEMAASELFNDGWWNCFESFVMELNDRLDPQGLRDICNDILNDAGVTSSEAYHRADTTLSDQTARDVAEYYANLKFID